MGVTDFVSEIKRAGSYPDFFFRGGGGYKRIVIVKNIEGESTEANYLSHIF